MAGYITEVIEKLKRADTQSPDAEDLIRMLEARQAELGEDADEAEITLAVEACIREHMAKMHARAKNSNDVDEDALAFLKTADAAVRAFFAAENWRYTVRASEPKMKVYQLPFRLDNGTLRVLLYIETDPRVCRIEAILPITADKTFAYPLCRAIAEQNYPRRFGALEYDEKDGELSYSYSYPIGHGVHEDDLRQTLYAVISSASDDYDVVAKHCVGKYRKKQKDEIIENVNALVRALRDDE